MEQRPTICARRYHLDATWRSCVDTPDGSTGWMTDAMRSRAAAIAEATNLATRASIERGEDEGEDE